MTVIWILTGLLFPPGERPGCLRGPDVVVMGGFCAAYDVDGDHRIDLFDFAEMQADWECGGAINCTRPVQLVGTPCD